jgi:hypothetical protein
MIAASASQRVKPLLLLDFMDFQAAEDGVLSHRKVNSARPLAIVSASCGKLHITHRNGEKCCQQSVLAWKASSWRHASPPGVFHYEAGALAGPCMVP